MNARRRSAGDSLDLLLDTLCSMFGAITLIVILVALLSRTGGATGGVQETSAEMMARKIALAEADLESTRRLLESVVQPVDPKVAAALAEKRQLTADLAQMKDEREKADQKLAAELAEQNVDISPRWKTLSAELAALERQQAETANSIAAQKQNTEQLRTHATGIARQKDSEVQARVVTLRLPKEQTRTRKAFPVICKFGKIYAVHDASLELNRKTIAWETNGGQEVSKPIESLGWRMDADRAEIVHLLQSISPAEYYLTFFVYPDSIATFRLVRDQSVAAGFSVGFELESANDIISWAADGSTPPPL